MADEESLVQAPEPRRERSSDPDFDARGGNRSNSREYERRYNSQNEDEFSNLPEDNDQLIAAQLADAQGYEAALAEQRVLEGISRRIRFQRNAGRFVLPKEGHNTYAAHLQLVRDGDKVDIHFDPAVYNVFDAIIVSNANRPDLFDPSHPAYPDYAMLRDNLAVLRNVLMSDYYTRDHDKQFSEHDEQFLPYLAEIAADIGKALNHPKGATRMFAHSISADLLNIEGEGAARAYEFIYERQAGNDFLSRVGVFIRALFGQPYRNWDLRPKEDTPLSLAGLSAAPPQDELCACCGRRGAAAQLPAQQAPKPPEPQTAEVKWKDRIYHVPLQAGVGYAG